MLCNRHIEKVGFAISEDMKQFDEYLDGLTIQFENITDLQLIIKNRYKLMNQPGLGKTCEIYFGRGLDKIERCSNWSSRPLRKEQIKYAAIDARVLLDLQEVMRLSNWKQIGNKIKNLKLI